MRSRLLLLIIFIFCVSCGSDTTSTGAASYKYQISGVAPLALTNSPFNELVMENALLSTNFILKWNESSGRIVGVYTNLSNGTSLNITGTSNGSGRVINAVINPPQSGIATLRFTIAQTGDLSGAISTNFQTLDDGGNILSSQAISTQAETTGVGGGGGNGGGGGGGGGGTTMTSYRGRYAGTVTETSDASNKCNLVQGTFKLVISNYDIVTYYSNYVDDDTAPYTTIVADTTGMSPATFDHTKAIGYTSAAGTTIGNGGVRSNSRLAGAFTTSGAVKTFLGTLELFETNGGSATCTYSLSLTKQ